MNPFDFLPEALEILLRLDVFVAIVTGLAIGVCIGALPGLTTATAMAIVLSATFFMDAIIAIPFLMGIYKGGIYGGSIPAILIATPGTGASVATVLDGPALVKQGKARKALDMALYASVAGDFSSDLVTLLLIGPIALLALLVGPPELVPIILLALVIVISVGHGSALLALGMALLGIFLASIGRDPLEYTPRLTFGTDFLDAGIPFLPMLVGLFALPELLRLLEKTDTVTSEHKKITAHQQKLSFSEFRAAGRTIGRSTLIGTIMGIVPGIGQPVAAFSSYAAAKNASKNPELFGRGSLEGIAAAEAGNNAVNGPTLIPMLTLGIPGDKITAVLMGAFVAHGLRPGPELIDNHGTIILAMLITMLVANLMLIVVARILIPVVVKLIYIRTSLLAPIIMIVAFTGAYLYRSEAWDLYVVIFFGVVGLAVKRANLDLMPLILGFIVAEPLEYAVGQTLALAGPDIVTYFVSNRLSALGLYMVLLLVVAWNIWQNSRRESDKQQNSSWTDLS